MTKSRLIYFLIATTFLMSSEARSSDIDFDSLQSDINDIVETAVRASGARGASAAVILPDGRLISATFGFSDVEEGRRITPDTKLLGGSTGKTFVATMIMLMAEDGLLSLDDKVSMFLGGEPWFERLPNHDSMTVRMLLNHSSGLPDHINQTAFQWTVAKNRVKDHNYSPAPEELIEYVLDLPPVALPGEMHAYTDSGYILLGLIIERVSGRSYYAELQQRILNPRGLSQVVPSNATQIDGLATGYVSGEISNLLSGLAGRNMEDGTLNLNPAIEWTGGGLATTPSSLVRFYRDLFRGKILSESSVEEMLTATAPNPTNPAQPYGLGFYILKNPEFGRYFHHSGWYPGYVSNVIWYEDINVGIALQYNQDYNADIYEPVKKIARLVKDVVSVDPE